MSPRAAKRGYTLLNVLIAGVIGMMVMVASVMMMKNLFKGSQIVGNKDARSEMKQLVLAAFSDTANCTCQLDRTVNTALAGPLSLDTTATPIPFIALGTLRTGCDFASTTNIIARDGQRTNVGSGDLAVETVRIVDIAPTGTTNQFQGTLQVKLLSSAGPLKPMQITLLFEIDPASGAPNSRRILRCMGPGTLGQDIDRDCHVVIPPTVVKGPCGIAATAACPAGERLLNGGGILGANLALQNSQPVLDSTNHAVGWYVTWLDTSGCAINYYSDGTTQPGTNPCYAAHPPGGGSGGAPLPVCGGVMAVCCR